MGLSSKIFTDLIFFLVFLKFRSSLAQYLPQDFLDPQNAARQAVGVGPREWDETVANYAKNYANQRSGDCVLQHSGGPYGENIYGGPGAGFGRFNAKDAVASWVVGWMRSSFMTIIPTHVHLGSNAGTTLRWFGATQCGLDARVPE